VLDRVRDKHPGSGVVGVAFFALCCALLRLYFRLIHRARVEGLEHLPDRGPLLLISNHQSYYDPPFIGCWITRRQIDFLARGSLFKFKPFARLISTLHAMPIKQGTGDSGAMKEALRRLAEGRAMLVFPEGSRSHDGAIATFERGTAVLLKRAHCPIVPIAVRGVYESWPRHNTFPRLFSGPIAVVYGEPIQSDELIREGPEQAMRTLAARVDTLAARADALRAR